MSRIGNDANETPWPRRALVSGILLVIAAAVFGCGTMQLNSHWLDRHITVDGSADDWEGLLVPVDDGAAYVGVMNDSSSVYFCLMTSRPDLKRRLARLGLLVSFQPEDHGKPPLAISYPVRSFGQERTPRAIQANGESPDSRPPDDHGFTSDPNIAELVGKGSQDRTRVTIDSLPGVELKIGGQRDWFVYELKVPMTSEGRIPCAVGSMAGQQLTVRLQAEKPDMSRMNERTRGERAEGEGGGEHGRGGWSGGGWSGGGRAGGGMGRGGRGGGGAPGQMPADFDVSAKVRLAPAPPI